MKSLVPWSLDNCFLEVQIFLIGSLQYNKKVEQTKEYEIKWFSVNLLYLDLHNYFLVGDNVE